MPKLRLLILVGELGSVVRMRRCLGRDLARSNSYRSFKPVLAPFDYAICNDVSVWLILRGKHWRLTCAETYEFSNVGYLGRDINNLSKRPGCVNLGLWSEGILLYRYS